MPLWEGRFNTQPKKKAWQLNQSIAFDQRLAKQDILGSIAWTGALMEAGVISSSEQKKLQNGLEAVAAEFNNGTFHFTEGDEDIHTAVERRLFEIAGSVAGKLHTGRSRNDQVATDFRLWFMDCLPLLDHALNKFQAALIQRAESDFGILMPGYTHLQRAQPVLLSHWWLSFFWSIQRDRERIKDLQKRVAVLPLGSGALSGTPYPVNREKLAASLGFNTPSPNSMDAVSNRDFAVEFLFIASLIGIHLSKLSEAVVLFTTAEFGFFEFSDAYSTGSSLMPQKKNPDHFELARGKAGKLIGLLSGLMTTLKGLPSTYDKDLQEDKLPVFEAFDTLLALLPVLAGAIQTIQVNASRMENAIDPSMMATDLADYLVEKGLSFREAYKTVGKTVQFAIAQGVPLNQLPLKDYQAIHTAFEKDLYLVFDPITSIEKRNTIGGTSSQAVQNQIEQAKIQIHAILNQKGE